jgi:drug/metabolite transporter (DMT)-like permease
MGGLFLGLLSSLGYGTADFIARFSSRKVGVTNVVFGVFLTGSILLTGYILLVGPGFDFTANGFWLLPLAGVANMAMLVLLYLSLARGPIGIAAPIVASHPGLVLVILAFLGVIPSLLEIIGLLIIIFGVIFLSFQTAHFTGGHDPKVDKTYIYKTALIAAAGSVAYALQVVLSQEAALVFGPYQAAWGTRFFGMIAVCLLLLRQGVKPAIPPRWWLVIFTQGFLDVIGVLSLTKGSLEQDRVIVAILSSTFAVVTVLLARIFIKEPVSRLQWLAIFIIVAGISIMSVGS